MDDKLINVLMEIAQDKAVVILIEKAINNGSLLQRCPCRYMSRACQRLCQKIWPDLVNDQCCCDKPNRLEIAQAIVALSKLAKKLERCWQQGDVVEIGSSHYVLCYTEGQPCQCNLFDLKNGCRKSSAVFLNDKRFSDCSASELFRGEPYKYLGHISELTIKNGKVIK